jgi:hypothetical protein
MIWGKMRGSSAVVTFYGGISFNQLCKELLPKATA